MKQENSFLDSILFEENPFENETPDEIRCFDLDGNEVSLNETK